MDAALLWGISSIVLGGFFVARSGSFGRQAARQADRMIKIGRPSGPRLVLLAQTLCLLLGLALVAWGVWALVARPKLT
jgi:hypothetical protein